MRALSSLGLLVPTLMACTPASSQLIGKDVYRIECGDTMSRCLSQADNLCRERGFTILRGQSLKRRLGSEDNGYVIAEGHVVVRCGLHGAELPDEALAEAATPPKKDEAKPRDRAAELMGTTCVPGATQQCVGPGACAGGQSCSADGRGFTPCDCGAQRVPPAALDQQPATAGSPTPAPPSTPEQPVGP